MNRILFIHNSADIYGASRSLVRLVGTLDRAAFRAVVLLPEDGPLAPRLRNAGAEVLLFSRLRVITRSVLRSWRIIPWIFSFPPSVFALASLIRRRRISLVHTNTGVICSSALAAKFAGVPHIWHIRDWFQEFGPLWKPYSRYILGLSTRVLCVSKAIEGQFPRSPKLEVLNNGFDLAEFPPISIAERMEARSRWGFKPDEVVVGTVGRIKFVRKGQEFLLQAMRIVKEEGMHSRCILAGGSPPGAEDQLPSMKKLAEELGLAEQTVFTGELTDARSAYATMDIFVLPSAQPEPFGGVVMEAMSLGLPVIGTDIGGTPEQVVDGETGFLIPPSDAPVLAEKLRLLIRDESRRAEMGNAARLRVAQHFSLDHMVKRIEATYRECLDGK